MPSEQTIASFYFMQATLDQGSAIKHSKGHLDLFPTENRTLERATKPF